MDSGVTYTTPTQKYICPLCECDQNAHLVFWKCPLFENELICQQCCHIEMLTDDIDKKVSARMGKEMTKDQINETCNKCGLNCGKQNPELATKLEEGKFPV